jgi:hypothetical protein
LDFIRAKTTGSSEVCIAILDTDIDVSDPGLASANLKRITLDGLQISSNRIHGTRVAKIIFSKHNNAGIAPDCRGIFIPIYGDSSSGLVCDQHHLAEAILLAAKNGAAIINISGGTMLPDNSSNIELVKAIEYCNTQYIQIVAAVGNEGCDCLHVPASIPSVLAVGGVDEQGDPYPQNNYGWAYHKQGLLTPLHHIPEMIGGETIKRTASSYAAPVVSAMLALFTSLQIRRGMRANPIVIKEILLQTADKCPMSTEEECERYLVGTVNLPAAWEAFTAQPENPSGSLEKGHETVAIKTPPPDGTSITQVEKNTVLEQNQAAGVIHPSSGHKEKSEQIAFVLGQVSYDFESEASKISLVNELGEVVLHQEQFVKLLLENSADHDIKKASPIQNINTQTDKLPYATSLIWKLDIENMPVYAIRPEGSFAREAYRMLCKFMLYNIEIRKKYGKEFSSLPRIALAGKIKGSVRTKEGKLLTVIAIEQRAMAILPSAKFFKLFQNAGKASEILSCMERIYFLLRNTGSHSKERAINYAVTYGLIKGEIFEKSVVDNLVLRSISAEKNPFLPPGIDGWDVEFTFFNPVKKYEEAATLYGLTVDVSTVVPALCGSIRNWKEHILQQC